MSTIPSLNEVPQLCKAYQALSQEAPNPEYIINLLPESLKQRIQNLSHPEESSRSKQLLMSIRRLTLEIHNSQLPEVRAKVKVIFERFSTNRSSTSGNAADENWNINNVKDANQTLLRSLEIISVERKVLEWAENDINRLKAAEKIMTFMNNPRNQLDLSSLGLTSLPDIFDNTQMRNRLHKLNLSSNQLRAIPESIASLTSLTELSLFGNQLEFLPETIEQLASLTKLNVNMNLLESIPESIGSLTSLSYLGVSHNRLISIPESIGRLTSLTILNVDDNLLESLPESIGMLTSLDYLDVSHNRLISIPESIGRLTSLTYLGVSGNKLRLIPESIGMLTSLHRLLAVGNWLESMPESIGTLISLTYLDVQHNFLQSAPNSIISLPPNCSVNLQDSGLSSQVLGRLREVCLQSGYAGPRFYFSIQDNNRNQAPQNLDASLSTLYAKAERQGFAGVLATYPCTHAYISNNPRKANSLQNWLSRLALMQPNGREVSKGISSKILSYLALAEANEVFREKFFNTIDGATETCGDRMTLSVLHLGIQHRMEVIDKSNLREFAEFLIHGPWMLDVLEEIARAKVATLRFVDEIEVYLGYPVKLRQRLNLQIDVEDMLYFACSGITEADLHNAASYIETQISTPDAIANILIQREDWVQALQERNPVAMAAFKRQKDSDLEHLEENDITSYEKIQEKYTQNILALTKNVLLH